MWWPATARAKKRPHDGAMTTSTRENAGNFADVRPTSFMHVQTCHSLCRLPASQDRVPPSRNNPDTPRESRCKSAVNALGNVLRRPTSGILSCYLLSRAEDVKTKFQPARKKPAASLCRETRTLVGRVRALRYCATSIVSWSVTRSAEIPPSTRSLTMGDGTCSFGNSGTP